MSPVITYVSGRLSCVPKVTVVSSVLGKQFSNSQASSGSAIPFFTSTIFASTASLRNFRCPAAGRLFGNSSPTQKSVRPIPLLALSATPAATETKPLITVRRLQMSTVSFTGFCFRYCRPWLQRSQMFIGPPGLSDLVSSADRQIGFFVQGFVKVTHYENESSWFPCSIVVNISVSQKPTSVGEKLSTL